MAAQLPRAERLARADDVLSNDGGIEDAARARSPQLHAKYLGLARRTRFLGRHGYLGTFDEYNNAFIFFRVLVEYLRPRSVATPVRNASPARLTT